MPYRELILFSYFIQGCHAILSALHIWLLPTTPVLNTIMVVVNAVAFIHAADWRARLRAHARRIQRNRDFFRR